MEVPAFYIVPVTLAQVPCLVRVHTKFAALGDLKGTSFSYAEREDVSPKIVFMRDQVEPIRGGVVSVEPGEAYRIDHAEEPDDITTTAAVARMPLAETVGLPVPDNYDDSFTATFDPAIFGATAVGNYLRIELDDPTPATPVALAGDEVYVFPLSTHTVLEDTRVGLLAAHDFVVADKLRARVLQDQYFIRADIKLISTSATNAGHCHINVGGTTGDILEVDHVVAKAHAGDDTEMSVFTRLPVGQDFLDNGAEMSIRFRSGVDLVGIQLYLSI